MFRYLYWSFKSYDKTNWEAFENNTLNILSGVLGRGMLLFNVIDRSLQMSSSSSLLGLILSFCPFFPFSHQSLVCEYCLSPSRALSRHLNSHVENKMILFFWLNLCMWLQTLQNGNKSRDCWDISGRLNSCLSIAFSSGPICYSWGDCLQPSVANIHCEWRYFSFCLLYIKDSLDEKSDADVSEGLLVW